ncbi:MAG: hypothetical protein IPL78_20990 [Chloroflexi bacterium]|nr:hypothetical protein [Chloroflexota bacterium]
MVAGGRNRPLTLFLVKQNGLLGASSMVIPTVLQTLNELIRGFRGRNWGNYISLCFANTINKLSSCNVCNYEARFDVHTEGIFPVQH